MAAAGIRGSLYSWSLSAIAYDTANQRCDADRNQSAPQTIRIAASPIARFEMPAPPAQRSRIDLLAFDGLAMSPIGRNAAALNLPLAARPRVGHIRLTGDVAEWLKAAVC